MNPLTLKIIAVVIVIIVILNFLLLIFHMVNVLQFWVTIIIAAIFAYVALPRLRKK
ncbi:MAG: hypothetical protein GY861_16170 [bacterium]|nr:hypothetical protein [bacterium]